MAQARIDELNTELKGMKKKYEDYSRTYTIRVEEYDKAVKETEIKWKEQLENHSEKLASDLKN